MQVTTELLTLVAACHSGMKFFLRRYPTGSADLQVFLDDLLAAGRVADCDWLLDRLRVPPGRVRTLPAGSTHKDGFVAGSVVCPGDLIVTGRLRASGAIYVAGSLRVGSVQAGGTLRASSIACEGRLKAARVVGELLDAVPA